MSVQPRPRHIVVLAHPDPQSFNATVARTYCETVKECGHEAILRDLYSIGFDPVLKNEERPSEHGFKPAADVLEELETIAGGDVFVLVFPIWFGMPPAMMKGYIDRVLGSGVTANEIRDRAGMTILKGRRLFSITSSGTTDLWLDEQGQIESLENVMGGYLSSALGMKSSEYLHIGHVTENYPENFVDQHMQVVKERAQKICSTLTDDGASANQS